MYIYTYYMHCMCVRIYVIYIYIHTVFLLAFKHVYSKDSTQKRQSGHERKATSFMYFFFKDPAKQALCD